jgi:hypothetical protein
MTDEITAHQTVKVAAVVAVVYNTAIHQNVYRTALKMYRISSS